MVVWFIKLGEKKADRRAGGCKTESHQSQWFSFVFLLVDFVSREWNLQMRVNYFTGIIYHSKSCYYDVRDLA